MDEIGRARYESRMDRADSSRHWLKRVNLVRARRWQVRCRKCRPATSHFGVPTPAARQWQAPKARSSARHSATAGFGVPDARLPVLKWESPQRLSSGWHFLQPENGKRQSTALTVSINPKNPSAILLCASCYPMKNESHGTKPTAYPFAAGRERIQCATLVLP